jgi:hypothetical protein
MRKSRFVVLLLLLVFLTSCAMLKSAREQLGLMTDQEKALVYLKGVQDVISLNVTESKKWVDNHPEHKQAYIKYALPALDKGNKTVKALTLLVQHGKVTAAWVSTEVAPLLLNIATYLLDIGFEMKKGGEKT